MPFCILNKRVKSTVTGVFWRSILPLQWAQQRSLIFRPGVVIGLKTSLRTLGASHHEANDCNGITQNLVKTVFLRLSVLSQMLRAAPMAGFILAPRHDQGVVSVRT